MKKWTIILLCLLSLLFLCVTATGTASNKALEEKDRCSKKTGMGDNQEEGDWTTYPSRKLLPSKTHEAQLTTGIGRNV
jgi:hypothetical protein